MCISSYLTNLNSKYSKVTDLIAELVYINDFCPVNFSIADGGNDLFDGGNMMAFKHYGDTIYNNEILPYTHTQSSNGGEDSIDYTDPPMDGTVQSALAYYGGNNSEYFTNMYPGLFVFVATGVEADFFTVYGDMGSDGAEIVTTDDDNVQPNEGYNVSSGTVINHNGQTYTMYTRFSQDGDHSDPTLNHIMIIPGDGGWDHEYRASSNEDYYDEILLDSSAQEIYFLMFATTEDRVSNAEEIAKKFLEVIKNDFVVPHPSPAYTFEVQTYTMQELIGLGYYGDFLTDIIRQREEAVVHIINTPLKHGDQFTRYGAEALRFKKLFVDVENPILKIIGTAPVVENNDSYSVLEGSTKCFSAFAEAVTPGDSRITYSLGTEHDESYFSINSTTGRITANDPLSIDNYVLEIIAENAYGVGSKLVDLVVTNGSMLWVNEINSVEQIKQDGNLPQTFIYNTDVAVTKGIINSFVGNTDDILAGDVLVLDNGSKILCGHVRSLGTNKIRTNLGLDYANNEFDAGSDYITIRRIPVENCFNATYTDSGPPSSGYFYYEDNHVYIGGNVEINAILSELDSGDQVRLFYNNQDIDQINGLNNLFTIDAISYDESGLWTITSSDPSFPLQVGDIATMFKKNW